MKILANSIPMTGLLTGIARYLRNLYILMGEMDQVNISYINSKRIRCELPALADSEKRQQTANLMRKLPDPVVFAFRAAHWLKYEYRLNQLCRKTKVPFSVYHETSFTPAKLTNVPTVYSVYDLSLCRYRETHPRDRVWMFEYFIKTRLRYAAHILTISEFVKQEIIDEFKVSPSMVTAIALAPDPLFGPSSAGNIKQVKQKYNLPDDYLLFVSSLEPRKNIDLLIDALCISKTDIPLVLVGWQGWGEKRWLDKVKRKKLKQRIYFTGHVPDHDLKALYGGAKALVYPSLYEGFGLPILEAMACNCPVICSNAASMPQVAGDAAILIDPFRSDDLARAIEAIVYDTETRNTLVKKGTRQAAFFTWKKTAEQTLDIFKMVAQ